MGANTPRATYRLPYFWSRMRLDERDGEIAYTCRRRWPDPQTATSRIHIRIGAPFTASDLNDRDHFLTARWVLFSAAGDRTRFARAWHTPWPLFHADPIDVDHRLFTMAGLPSPEGQPIVHYSPGVDVRIGRPQRYRPRAAPQFARPGERRSMSDAPAAVPNEVSPSTIVSPGNAIAGHLARLGLRTDFDEDRFFLILSIFIGVFSGLAVVCFRVAIDWTLDLIFAKDFVQFLTVRAPVMSMREAPADELEYAHR